MNHRRWKTRWQRPAPPVPARLMTRWTSARRPPAQPLQGPVQGLVQGLAQGLTLRRAGARLVWGSSLLGSLL